jgi:hypothetical protein
MKGELQENEVAAIFFLPDYRNEAFPHSSVTTQPNRTPRFFMTVTLTFDPQAFDERTLRLIMKKAEEWECRPGEALARLLDQAADEANVPVKTPITAGLQAVPCKPAAKDAAAKPQ